MDGEVGTSAYGRDMEVLVRGVGGRSLSFENDVRPPSRDDDGLPLAIGAGLDRAGRLPDESWRCGDVGGDPNGFGGRERSGEDMEAPRIDGETKGAQPGTMLESFAAPFVWTGFDDEGGKLDILRVGGGFCCFSFSVFSSSFMLSFDLDLESVAWAALKVPCNELRNIFFSDFVGGAEEFVCVEPAVDICERDGGSRGGGPWTSNEVFGWYRNEAAFIIPDIDDDSGQRAGTMSRTTTRVYDTRENISALQTGRHRERNDARRAGEAGGGGGGVGNVLDDVRPGLRGPSELDVGSGAG